jgi:hypothetical protein
MTSPDLEQAPDRQVVHAVGPIDACPGCAETEFLVMTAHDAVAFRCVGCAALWRYELGFVWAVQSTSEEINLRD